MAAKCGAHLLQLNFIGAFFQAPIKTRTFVKLPQFLAVFFPDYAQYCGVPLRLLMSMYSMSVCGRNWFEELHDWLVDPQGGNFQQSKFEPAVFFRIEDTGSTSLRTLTIPCTLIPPTTRQFSESSRQTSVTSSTSISWYT